MKDVFGDRMKMYEEEFTKHSLRNDIPVYARLDGRSFSNLTRDLPRPFCSDFAKAMVAVTSYLVEHTHACIGYTQSDEISLAWKPGNMIFDGKIQKLASVLSGMAAARLALALPEFQLQDLQNRYPHFDCRVLNLPNEEETANMFLWRTQDANRNAISMAASANFSHKELQGVSTSDRLVMLNRIGIRFDDYPDAFKHGTFVRRENYQLVVTEDTCQDIPEQYRPEIGSTITRSRIVEIDMPKFGLVKNRARVIFNNEAPNTGWSANI